MAKIICPNCGNGFNMNNPNSIVTRVMAASAGSLIGALTGARVGIAGGPAGAASGLVPGTIVGAIVGFFTADQFRKCPTCKKIFKT